MATLRPSVRQRAADLGGFGDLVKVLKRLPGWATSYARSATR
jgi:hypothetical protein